MNNLEKNLLKYDQDKLLLFYLTMILDSANSDDENIVYDFILNLEKSSFLNLAKKYGGKKIRIPTYKELIGASVALLYYYYVNILNYEDGYAKSIIIDDYNISNADIEKYCEDLNSRIDKEKLNYILGVISEAQRKLNI